MNMAVSKLLAAHLRRFADCAGVMYTSTHSAIRRVGNLKGGKKAHKYAFIQVGLSKYTHAAVHTPVLSVFILTINAAWIFSFTVQKGEWPVTIFVWLLKTQTIKMATSSSYLYTHTVALWPGRASHSGGRVYFPPPAIWVSRVTCFGQWKTSRSLEMTWTWCLLSCCPWKPETTMEMNPS